MIGAFPRGDAWVTLQLAAGRHDRVELRELLGECPGDPQAHITRATICAGAEEALALASAQLRRGWAAHASVDEPGDTLDAAAALHAPACAPQVAVTDTALAPEQARAVVAHATAATREPFCLFANPTAGQRVSADPVKEHKLCM